MKKLFIIPILIFYLQPAVAQDTLGLHDIIMHIDMHSEHLQMFDAQAKAEDAAAEGAYTWQAPELGGGFWMMPYNPKMLKGENGMRGMGQYMITAQQMLPNKKTQLAEHNYLKNKSVITRERKDAMQNELYAAAKKNFYEWMVVKKKMQVLNEGEKLVEFMIQTAEIKYKNNTGDITAYYKAKAALGNLHTNKVQLQNEELKKRIALNTLMHQDRNYAFDIDTNYEVKDFSHIKIDSVTVLNSRSDIAAVSGEIEITGLQQELERQKLNPEFGLRFDHMMGLGNMPAQFSAMAMVKIPLAKWSSKGIKANIESLKWQAVAKQKEREAVINEVLGEAYTVQAEILITQRAGGVI